MWNIRIINKAILLVVGALGSISKKLKNCLEELGVVISPVLLQKKNTARDSLYIKEGFRLQIRFLEKGGGEKGKKVVQGERGKWSQKLNR